MRMEELPSISFIVRSHQIFALPPHLYQAIVVAGGDDRRKNNVNETPRQLFYDAT